MATGTHCTAHGHWNTLYSQWPLEHIVQLMATGPHCTAGGHWTTLYSRWPLEHFALIMGPSPGQQVGEKSLILHVLATEPVLIHKYTQSLFGDSELGRACLPCDLICGLETILRAGSSSGELPLVEAAWEHIHLRLSLHL